MRDRRAVQNRLIGETRAPNVADSLCDIRWRRGPPHKTSGIDSVGEQCHLPCMSGKTTPTGWVVQLTIPVYITPTRADGTPWTGPAILGAPSFQYFNVAIADAEMAVEATGSI